MLEILTASAICLVLVFKELIPLFNQDKKLFYLYSAILGATYILWLLHGFDIKVPSPAQPIKDIITLIFNLRG